MLQYHAWPCLQNHIRRKCRANLKLAVNVLEVAAQQITNTGKRVGGFEQPNAFARRNPWTRSLPWCERNVTFELKQFIHDPDNDSLTSGPQAPPQRRHALETLSGPGNKNVDGKNTSVDIEFKRNHKKVKKETGKKGSNSAAANHQRLQASKSSSTTSALLKNLKKLNPSDARTFRRLKNSLSQLCRAKGRKTRWLAPSETVSFMKNVHKQVPHALRHARLYLIEQQFVPIHDRQLRNLLQKHVLCPKSSPLPNFWGRSENHVVVDTSSFATFAESATETGESLDPTAVEAHLTAQKIDDGQYNAGTDVLIDFKLSVSQLSLMSLLMCMLGNCRNLAQYPNNTQVCSIGEYSETLF